MLLLGRRRLRDRAGWLDGGAYGRRRRLKAAEIATGCKRKARAQQHGRSPKAAALPAPVPSRTLSHVDYPIAPDRLIPADQFNLPHPEQLNSRSTARLDPAADANPPILKRFRRDSSGLECPQHAP